MNSIVNLVKRFNIKDTIINFYSDNINRNFSDFSVIMKAIFFAK